MTLKYNQIVKYFNINMNLEGFNFRRDPY